MPSNAPLVGITSDLIERSPGRWSVAVARAYGDRVVAAGGIPVLLGYSLGKAQEILCALAEAGHPVMLHKSVWDMTRAVAPLLGPAERRWLREQLERLHPGHAWLGRLSAG